MFNVIKFVLWLLNGNQLNLNWKYKLHITFCANNVWRKLIQRTIVTNDAMLSQHKVGSTLSQFVI